MEPIVSIHWCSSWPRYTIVWLIDNDTPCQLWHPTTNTYSTYWYLLHLLIHILPCYPLSPHLLNTSGHYRIKGACDTQPTTTTFSPSSGPSYLWVGRHSQVKRSSTTSISRNSDVSGAVAWGTWWCHTIHPLAIQTSSLPHHLFFLLHTSLLT